MSRPARHMTHHFGIGRTLSAVTLAALALVLPASAQAQVTTSTAVVQAHDAKADATASPSSADQLQDRRLARAGIEIPFPQRDVRINVAHPLSVRMTNERPWETFNGK